MQNKAPDATVFAASEMDLANVSTALLLEAAAYLESAGMPVSLLRDMHHSPRRGETFNSTRQYFSRVADLQATNRLYGARLIYVANLHRKTGKPFPELVLEVLSGGTTGLDVGPPADHAGDWEQGRLLADESIPQTERQQLVNARVGQGLFRSRVELVEPSCRLTGISDRRFLRASHIKPWAQSTNAEKLDGANGLMLSPHVDHLFDKGFISFNDDGSLIISKHVPQDVIAAWSVFQPVAARPLQLHQAAFMRYHRDVVFMG